MQNIRQTIRFAESLGRLLSGKASPTDKKNMRRWYQKSSSYADQMVGKIVSAENLRNKIEFYEHYKPEEAWQIFDERISKIKPIHKKTYKLRYIGKIISYSAASVILMALGVGVYQHIHALKEQQEVMKIISAIEPGGSKAVLYLTNHERMEIDGTSEALLDSIEGISIKSNTIAYQSVVDSHNEQYNTLITPPGGEFHLQLADGTDVWINAESELKYYVNNAGSERVVYLTGEAYFKVKPDKNCPFIVVSGEHRVRVLGTEFNISAYETDPMIYTTLVGGAVNVAIGNSDLNQRIDNSGRQTIFNKAGNKNLTVRQVDPRTYTAWKDGSFVFSYSTLDDIMKKLARWYDFKYEIQNPALNKSYFSGEFDRFDNLGKILEILKSTGIPIELSYQNNQIIIR